MNKSSDHWKDLWEKIDQYSCFLVTSHVGPDGDNIGSSMGWTLALRNLGKEAYFVLDDKPPTGVRFLLPLGEPLPSQEAEDIVKEKKYALCALDCANKERLAVSEKLLNEAQEMLVIDHHQSDEYYGHLNLVRDQVSSTCQIVAQGLFEKCPEVLSKEVAQCLYVGMVTDTGRFLFGNEPAQTLRLAADLLDRGVPRDVIMDSLYRSNSVDYIRLTGEVLSTIEIQGKVCFMYMTQEMLNRNNVSYNDIEMLVDYTINLEGIELGIFAKEKSMSEYRISLRSKGKIDVSTLASSFGGGGHKAASGCTIREDIKEVKVQLFKEIFKLYDIKGI